MLALDVACALEAQGEAVCLILLDSSLASRRPSIGTLTRWAVAQARSASGVIALLGRLARRMARGAPPEWIPGSQVAFAARMIRVGASYRPSRFFGPTLIVKALERDPLDQLFDEDGLMGWSDALKGPVLRASVHGGHHTFLREPRVAETALEVSRFLSAHE